MYNYTPLTNLATSMPTIVARSVIAIVITLYGGPAAAVRQRHLNQIHLYIHTYIASRNSDPPPSENLTNTALTVCTVFVLTQLLF